MKIAGPLPILICCLLASACQREPGSALNAPNSASPLPGLVAPPEGIERVWSGLLPCRDCEGIDTRLVLRNEEGRRVYLMTEHYLGGPGKNMFNRAGQWSEARGTVNGEEVIFYLLDPDRGAERFALRADGSLELLDGNGKPSAQSVAYRLQRL